MILTYRDLDVWKNAMDLAEKVYIITKYFPSEERYGLTSQIRRCSVSIPSNIAEGFMRKNTREYIQFLHIALGSLGELDTQLELSVRVGYIKEEQELKENITTIRKQLYGLVKVLKEKL